MYRVIKSNNSILGGVRVNENGYTFDYTYDYPSDVVKLIPPQLYSSKFGKNTYWFGYQFQEDVSSKDRADFIHYIKGLFNDKIPDDSLRRFIEKPLWELDKVINLYSIDTFVYPLSGRSPLVRKMIQIIGEWTSRDMKGISFELVKSLPKDVEFDWDLFDKENKESQGYDQMVQHIENNVIPKIRNLDYFSIANAVKPKYRKYITNYLSFSDKDIEKLQSLKGNNILIVDDINTSGATLQEILRIINKINKECNIFIYTLIGKP